MNPTTIRVNTHGRMLAFLIIVALIATMSVPIAQPALADGSGGNDTLTGMSAGDSTEVVQVELEPTETTKSGLALFLIFISSLLI